MRAAWLVLVAACTPDIASSAYDCGANGACPNGQVCNPADATCVFKGMASPFACEAPNVTGDDTPATGAALSAFTCVSAPTERAGCLPTDDTADWFQLDAPTGCTAVKLVAHVTFPLAFENIALDVAQPSGTMQAVDTACPGGSKDLPFVSRCFELTMTAGAHYAIGVHRDGTGNCKGDCSFNSYLLTLQTATP